MGVPRKAFPRALTALYDYLDSIISGGSVTLPTGGTQGQVLVKGASTPAWGKIAADTSSQVAQTTGATATAVDLTAYESRITTGGTAGNEAFNLGASPAVKVGFRKLITLVTRTHASDKVVIDHANVSSGALTVSAVVLDAANEFLLVERRGTKWEVIAASAGVVTAA